MQSTNPQPLTPIPRLRVGFAGEGVRGQALRDAAGRVPGLLVAATASPAEHALPGPVQYPDYEAMIETAGLDAVILATTPDRQPLYTRMALARGIHTLVPLPLAPTQAEADALLDTAEASGARLVVDMPYHLAPATVAMRAALAAGRLGTLLAVEAQCYHLWGPPGSGDRAEAGGRALLDLGAPLLALVLHLLDLPPTTISSAFMRGAGRAPELAAEDFAVLTGSLAGVPFRCAVGWHAPLPRPDIRVVLRGTAGVLTWSNVKGSLTEFAARLSYHQGEEPLASGPAGSPDDTLRVFVAACAAPLAPDLAPLRLLAALLQQAYDLAGQSW